jgi:RNA polymerase sigma factor (sigma-70 family)
MARPRPEEFTGPTLDVVRYRPILLSFFRKRAHPADVEDLVQDVFVSLQARQAEAPIQNVEGYIFAVAMSALVRKGQRERNRRFHAPYDEDQEAQALADGFSPERIALGKERLAGAVRIMEQLPPRTQEVFLLHRFEEMTYPAIAAALEISVSAVEKHIMIALKILVADLGRNR